MTIDTKSDATTNGDQPRIDSVYRLIIVAGLRSKQLLRGSQPRIVADPLKRKNTSIALEEIKQGLVHYTVRKGAGDFNPSA
jgi:DNA-directed RNA polymerase omega subunit